MITNEETFLMNDDLEEAFTSTADEETEETEDSEETEDGLAADGFGEEEV